MTILRFIFISQNLQLSLHSLFVSVRNMTYLFAQVNSRITWKSD